MQTNTTIKTTPKRAARLKTMYICRQNEQSASQYGLIWNTSIYEPFTNIEEPIESLALWKEHDNPHYLLGLKLLRDISDERMNSLLEQPFCPDKCNESEICLVEVNKRYEPILPSLTISTIMIKLLSSFELFLSVFAVCIVIIFMVFVGFTLLTIKAQTSND